MYLWVRNEGGFENNKPKRQELAYTESVSIDRNKMVIEGLSIQLLPGMAVTVEIKTGSRRIISYLLSPLMRYNQEVLRER
jgi:hemolysin D